MLHFLQASKSCFLYKLDIRFVQGKKYCWILIWKATSEISMPLKIKKHFVPETECALFEFINKKWKVQGNNFEYLEESCFFFFSCCPSLRGCRFCVHIWICKSYIYVHVHTVIYVCYINTVTAVLWNIHRMSWTGRELQGSSNPIPESVQDHPKIRSHVR